MDSAIIKLQKLQKQCRKQGLTKREKRFLSRAEQIAKLVASLSLSLSLFLSPYPNGKSDSRLFAGTRIII
jgi:hypothetical protein